MRINNEDLLEIDGVRTEMDMSVDFALKPIYLGSIVNYGIQLFFTGDPDGYFKLQGSSDAGHPNATREVQQYEGVDHWTDVLNTKIIISEAGDVLYEGENIGVNWLRVVWTAETAGSTPLLNHARANVKGI